MFRLERGPLLVSTLAICLARKTFGEVHFVTDTRGAELARVLRWQFDHVQPALATLARTLPGCEFVWAAGKLAALALHDGPCVQFDGDVLLLKGELPARFLASPLLAQSQDIPAFYRGPAMQKGFEISGLPHGFKAFNAGLVGGSEVELVREYALQGLELVRRFAHRSEEINGTAASMLCEQYHLGTFAELQGVKVRTLLAMFPAPAAVRRVGYAHLVGDHKRNPAYVARAEERLRAQFPTAYALFCEGWKTLAGSSSIWPEESPWCAAL